jgi:hypothetical protein
LDECDVDADVELVLKLAAQLHQQPFLLDKPELSLGHQVLAALLILILGEPGLQVVLLEQISGQLEVLLSFQFERHKV